MFTLKKPLLLIFFLGTIINLSLCEEERNTEEERRDDDDDQRVVKVNKRIAGTLGKLVAGLLGK
uniref:Hainanensis-like protein n=1 Tax=Hydrophylax bahuvistara TaxID=1690667 RepID=A0A2U8XQF4_HYDBH|nr:hainanensis-like protein precursor [Hydrophylax bahuvistara]